MYNYKKYLRKILLIALILLIAEGNQFFEMSRNVFSQVITGTDVKKTDKSTGAQVSAFQSTSFFSSFVKGKVYDNTTGLPILEANIILKQSETIVVSDTTSDNGTFFLRVLPGTYTIIVSKSGFKEKSDEFAVSSSGTISKNIGLVQDLSLTPTPVLNISPTPTPEPSASPTPTPVPTFSSTPTQVPTAIPECKQGGIPSDILILPRSIKMKPGQRKMIRMRVVKEPRGGCTTDVKVNCVEGCDLIMSLSESITTNRRGIAYVVINAKSGKEGVVTIIFRVGDIEAELPIIIGKRGRK